MGVRPIPFVTNFKPSTNAPQFANGPWPPGTEITLIDIPGLPKVSIDATKMGFCGGMSFLTRDIFESGTQQLRGTSAALIPLSLARMILTRLGQSFSGPNVVPRWLHATSELDHGTVLLGPGLFAETVADCAVVTSEIDAGRLCPIGVVLTQSAGPWDVFQNHVELVWGYERAGDILTLHVYDCNNPNRDDIVIQLDVSSPTPAKTITTNGTAGPAAGTIRGFFPLPYTHADPSPAYIDDAVVTTLALPPAQMALGATAPVTISVTNTGSTTWTTDAGYHLGSQSPQDNLTWGTGRVPLPPGSWDPQQTKVFAFGAHAPGTAGTYDFAWEMVHDGVHWFGVSTPPMRIAVGASGGGVCDGLHQQHVQLAQQLAQAQDELAAVDWTDPVIARREAARIAVRVHSLQTQISSLEAQQTASGCAPG